MRAKTVVGNDKIKTIAFRGGAFILVISLLMALFLCLYATKSRENAVPIIMEETNADILTETTLLTEEFSKVSEAASFAAEYIAIGGDVSDELSKIVNDTIADIACYYNTGVLYGINGGTTDITADKDYAGLVALHSENYIFKDEHFVIFYPYGDGTGILCKVPVSVVFDGFSDEEYYRESVTALYKQQSDMNLQYIAGGEDDSVFLLGNIKDNIKNTSPAIWNSILIGLKDGRQVYSQITKDGECRYIATGSFKVCNVRQSLVLLINSEYINDTYASNSYAKLGKTVRAEMIVVLVLFIITYVATMGHLINHSTEKSKELSDKADTDLLTGLNNKMTTERLIQKYIDDNPNSQGVLILLDVDNFKKVNDTMGHAFGDEVLSQLGTRLRSLYRASDIIGRIGGDEFIVFLKDIRDKEIIEREAGKLNNFFKDFEVGQYVKYSVTGSLGAAIYSEDGKSFEELYKNADIALYNAKTHGKKQLVFYRQDEKKLFRQNEDKPANSENAKAENESADGKPAEDKPAETK